MSTKLKESAHAGGQKSPAGAGQIGRRDALKKIGMASAAIAVPLVLPSRLLAQAVAQSDELPPSERLNLGLVGMGNAMSKHMRTLLTNTDILVRSVCDVDRRKLSPAHANVLRSYRRISREYGKALVTRDHREVMARDDIDGVVIATPVHWHAAITLDAIRAGKDVLCQSPLTLTVREGQLVRDAADQHGAIVQVIAPQRTEAQMLYCCELVRNGYIGKVKEIYVKVGRFGEEDDLPKQTVPEELDYDRWLGPAPWADFHSVRISSGTVSGWRRFWDYGVRKHGEIGFGHYDIIQWALGTEQTGPTEFRPKGFGGDPYASYQYESGIKVELDRKATGDQHIEFIGTQASVTVSARGHVNSIPQDLTRTKFNAGELRLPEVVSTEFAWVESMKTRTRPLVDAAIGHRSSTICHLNAITERLGRPITWDPEKEEIVGDQIASRMLDRPRRAPYGLT